MRPIFQEVIQTFLQFKRNEGLKSHTLLNYGKHVSLFFETLPLERTRPHEITTFDVANYLSQRTADGLKPRSVRGVYRSLHVFFAWLEDMDEYDNPPHPFYGKTRKKKIKPPKVPHPLPRPANLKDVETLEAALPHDCWQNVRNHAIIHMMRETGLRVGEVTNLRLRDVDLQHRLITARGTKNGKDRQVPISASLHTLLQQWLQWRPTDIHPKAPWFHHLFLSAWSDSSASEQPRGALSVTGVQQMLKKLSNKCGVEPVTAHSLRHLFACTAINAGIRVESISELLGHADVGFTKRTYAGILPETVHNEFDEHWGLNP